jgi:hypothetical protein
MDFYCHYYHCHHYHHYHCHHRRSVPVVKCDIEPSITAGPSDLAGIQLEVLVVAGRARAGISVFARAQTHPLLPP